MSGVLDHLALFHFIRPWWLLLIPIALVLWWRVRHRATRQEDTVKGLAPHLADALRVGSDQRRRLLPIDGVAALMVLAALAAAGPTWSRIANPLLAQTAPLAIALATSESMLSRDVAPSRLERAKFKIEDLLATRAGARTALIAYAGSAHTVTPLTEDPEVLKPFLEGLSPEIMPSPGNNATAALTLAASALAAEPTPGAILFVADAVDRADIPAFQAHNAADGAPVIVYAVSGDAAALDDLAGLSGVSGVALTPDGADVATIERRVASAYREALAADERLMWNDRGWILAWPALVLTLAWFRRGWTMRWSLVLVTLFSLGPVQQVRAAGIADWFWTPDQQGRMAFDDKRYDDAAALFQDPEWRGYALYRAGKYEEAADVFSRIDTAEAAFSEGMAHIKSRGYRNAVAAFEAALERDPDYEAAARNLVIARAIVDYVERVREQSDTGEDSGIGADDIVFDNESGRGAETQISGADAVQPLSAEQWMRTVDTQTSDFLRTRFALEAARGRQ